MTLGGAEPRPQAFSQRWSSVSPSLKGAHEPVPALSAVSWRLPGEDGCVGHVTLGAQDRPRERRRPPHTAYAGHSDRPGEHRKGSVNADMGEMRVPTHCHWQCKAGQLLPITTAELPRGAATLPLGVSPEGRRETLPAPLVAEFTIATQ